MRSSLLAGLGIVLAAAGGPAAVAEQLYKWIDERGVVTYSDRRPADQGEDKVQRVAGNLSVYSPDQPLLHAIAALRAARRLPQPVVAATRPPAPYVPAMSPGVAGTEPCPDGECGGYYAVRPYVLPSSAWFAGRRAPPNFPQAVLPQGTIAGAVNGTIPGNSAGFKGMIPGTLTPVPSRPLFR